MILFHLLNVVVDESADVGLGEGDLGEDLVGGGGPGEGLGVSVPVLDVVTDRLDEDFDRREGAAADSLAGDDPEPGFWFIHEDPIGVK